MKVENYFYWLKLKRKLDSGIQQKSPTPPMLPKEIMPVPKKINENFTLNPMPLQRK